MSRFFALAPMGAAALMTGCNTAPDIEQQVNELYNKMSNEERIAQLRSMYMDELFNEQGKLDTAMCRKLIPNGIGHFSQFAMQKPRTPNDLDAQDGRCAGSLANGRCVPHPIVQPS